MRNIILFLLLLPLMAYGQTYKHIGVEDGLSNRRIYNIQKDHQGYMWFLTNEGMDRYNGKDIKHYKLIEENKQLSSEIHLGWLYADKEGGIWVIGKKGRIFQYEEKYDRFTMVYKSPKVTDAISYGYLDRNNNLWLCGKDSILLYNTKTTQVMRLPNLLEDNITVVEQADDTHFFIATEMGVRYTQFENEALKVIPLDMLDHVYTQINSLYFHPQLHRLFVGTFSDGTFAYDMSAHQIIKSDTKLGDVSITHIRPLNQKELLVATEGMGVHKIDVNTCNTSPFIVANYESYNEMNGNNITDIYIDEEKRIWLANYPAGITVVDFRYKNYRWIKHSIGNKQSIVNDQVHAVIEDSEGDLWFGTSNGISFQDSKTGQWHSFLSSYDKQLKDKNHIFITLCEVSPGVIWAGGYTSGIYKINKKTLSVEYFSPFLLSSVNIRPDKYIRDMIKDSKGYIWSGGYYNLKCIDPRKNTVRLYPGVNTVTAIEEKDTNFMWVGTATGLFLLNRNSGEYQYILMPVESTYINTLYQANDGLLYIGTNGSGVLIYDPGNMSFEHYYADNSALVSNSIYTILPEMNGQIMMSTENGITSFSIEKRSFHNWSREQGMMSACFNATSGALRKNNNFVFGSVDGAVEFPAGIKLPDYEYSKMIFSDFHISYQPIYPGEKDSPLEKDIDKTDVLRLKYGENTFSFRVSSINYDFPSHSVYYWRLEGSSYNEWVQLSGNSLIRFTNLSPGKYKLYVRAISKEEPSIVFEERQVGIIISQPVWLNGWAIFIYMLLIVFVFSIAFRIMILKKQKKISDEKTHFFINTAHDIRTPLTLIKAPLEEFVEEETLTEIGSQRINTALRNVNALLRLSTNLINFERADVYSSELRISEYELNTYMNEICNSFRSYANIKHIDFTYKSDFNYLNVWFDKDKMDSILKNLISNALKYTPENGIVSVSISETKDSWKLEVKDTGIGIPANEQNKLLKMHFRGTNAINAKITGSGIGLKLVDKLVHLHSGKINIESVEQQGTTITVVFPKGNKHFRHSNLIDPEKTGRQEAVLDAPVISEAAEKTNDENLQRILIVEDNDELRAYLVNSLSPMYNVQACGNGKEALIIVKEFWPELILSDIMMPEMRGDELCSTIKNDIETSHIPVLLLTALGEEQNILDGLDIGADEYIVKPFSIRILKASIANLLANRALLRSKYANLEIDIEVKTPLAKCTNSLDWQFLSAVKKTIEDNINNPAFSVEVLNDLHNMSRTRFYYKLKSITGLSPQELIKTTRLKRATQLLKEGEYNITEISEMCGFSESKYFREVFKKEYKMSPSQYAKKYSISSSGIIEDDSDE
mgnify:FL=1